MNSHNVDLFLLSKGSLFPKAQLPLLREMLGQADDDKWTRIVSAKFRNPNTALIMSVAVGAYGADRFYLGQPLLGAGKLLVTILFLVWYVAIECATVESWLFVLVGLTLVAALVLWYFIDIFLVSKTVKNKI